MTDYEDIRSLDAETLAERLLESVGRDHWPPVHTAVEWVMERHGGQERRDGTDFMVTAGPGWRSLRGR